MTILGGIIAIGSALGFVVVALVIIWGVRRALQREVTTSFRSVPPPPANRVLTVLGVVLPALGAALLALLGAARIVQVALGLG